MTMFLAANSTAAGVVPLWVQGLVATIPILGAVLAYRQATKATRATQEVEDKKVDAEAYLVAKGFYEDMLVERKTESVVQQTQITQLNAQIIELQRSLNAMQLQQNARHAEETQLREQIGRLGLDLLTEQQRSRNLGRRVIQLESHLRALDTIVPPPTEDDDETR